jgi:RNA polymerase sigma factor for flagellar operon FliA
VAAETGFFERLWRDYRRTGDERLKGELTRKFMPTLVCIAEKVRWEMGNRPDLSDLVSAGVVGLLEAFERFDPARCVRFESFCGWRVVGAMHDDQRKFDWASGAIRLKAQRLRAAADDLTASLGRHPTDEELAEAMGISIAEVAEAQRHARNRAPLSIDRAEARGSRTPDPGLEDRRLDPVRLLLAEEARTLLLDALKGLPDKQRHVLLLYYFEKLTMGQIGPVLNLTESRVSQLHRKALNTLVRRLGRRKDELLDALGG